MSGKFTIKPPIWPKEYTFTEFARLNPHIRNENQLIQLYNQYLSKYLEELRQKKVHFKQSLNNHLLNELINNNFNNTLDDNDSYDGDSTGDGGPVGGPSVMSVVKNSFYTFEGNTQRTFFSEGDPNYPAADYLELFDPEDYSFEKGFTIAFFARFNELGSLFTTTDQKFVFGRGASNKSQIRFGIEGDVTLGNHFNIGVGDTTVSGRIYGGPSGSISGSSHVGYDFESPIPTGDEKNEFTHYTLSYRPENKQDTTTSGSVFFAINGIVRGTFSTRFTPVKNDVSASNYEGGKNFFIGGHNQFAVLAGNVQSFQTVQPPLTFGSFVRYNNNVSGYYDGMACSVDEFAFFNEFKEVDEISKIYNTSLNTRNLVDENGEITDPAFGKMVAYYQFDQNPDDSSNNSLHGVPKEAPNNIGVDNYGRIGADNEVDVDDVVVVSKDRKQIEVKFTKFKPTGKIHDIDL